MLDFPWVTVPNFEGFYSKSGSDKNEANVFYRELLDKEAQIKSLELKEPFTIFAENILSGERLLTLPAKMLTIYQGGMQVEAIKKAAFIDPTFDIETGFETTRKASARIGKEVHLATGHILNSSDDARRGAQALYQSIASRAWGAFESLAKQMWISCLNSRPLQLGDKAYLAEQQDESHGFDSRSVPLKVLQKYSYDISHRLGEILAEEKFSMHGTAKIKDAYLAAFGKNANVFDGVDLTSLAKLYQIRNLIQHNCAFVDAEFKKATPSTPHSIGELLPLNGDLVESYLKLSSTSGMKFINNVDLWMQKNPVKQKKA